MIKTELLIRNSIKKEFTGYYLFIIGSLLLILSYIQGISIYSTFFNNYAFNIIYLIPYAYWISIFFFVASIFYLPKDKLPYFLSFIIIVFMNVFNLFFPLPTIYDSYWHFSNVENIGYGNYSLVFSTYGSLGAFLFGATFTFLSGPNNNLAFLFLFPILFNIVVYISLLAVFKEISYQNSYISFFILLFFVFDNSIESHFSPQALGFIVFCFFLSYLARLEKEFKPSILLSSILLIVVIGIIHTISFLIAILAYFIFIAMKLFQSTHFSPKKHIIILGVAFLPIIIVGLLLVSVLKPILLETIIAIITNSSVRNHYFIMFFQFKYVNINVVNINTTIRIFMHLFAFVCFLIAFVLSFYKVNSKKLGKITFLSIFFASIAYLFFVLFFLFGYLYERTILYIYIAFLGIIVLFLASVIEKFFFKKNIQKYNVLFIMFISILFLFSISTNLNSNSGAIISDEELICAKYFIQNFQNTNTSYLVYQTNALLYYYNPTLTHVYFSNRYWNMIASNRSNYNLSINFGSQYLITIITKNLAYYSPINQTLMQNYLLWRNASLIYANTFCTGWFLNLKYKV